MLVQSLSRVKMMVTDDCAHRLFQTESDVIKLIERYISKARNKEKKTPTRQVPPKEKKRAQKIAEILFRNGSFFEKSIPNFCRSNAALYILGTLWGIRYRFSCCFKRTHQASSTRANMAVLFEYFIDCGVGGAPFQISNFARCTRGRCALLSSAMRSTVHAIMFGGL